jgi:superfamily II DNA or RNA helicase
LVNNSNASDRRLFRWQLDALIAWLRCGRRGVIEAVTGAGKTEIAIAAASDALRRGRFVLVLVPSRVLMEQWHTALHAALPDVRIGRLGDDGRDTAATCDVLVATRHSAAAYKPIPPGHAGGLLVVDECHGLGGKTLRRALLREYDERLGLTATLERSDDAVTELLIPFFGGICYRYGFEQAIADGVCARPRVAFVGVPLSKEERKEYVAVEQRLVTARQHLRGIRDMPLEPFGDFLAAVSYLAERAAGEDGRAARDYLDAFSKRRAIVAQSTGKYDLLGKLAPAIKEAEGALVFTETVRAANHAINRLDPYVAVELITGSTARGQRREILDDLRRRALDAVAAPRVLDEGIDVPDANLGVVMSASRTRRQMIQRMGRILRRKRSGIAARFVIMYAQDTLEDPSNRFERDGFVDEMERISEATGVFDSTKFDALDEFLAVPGPSVVPEPSYVDDDAGTIDVSAAVEAEYARLAYTNRRAIDRARVETLDRLEARLAKPAAAAPRYVELSLAHLPTVAKPKTAPKRLSTGEVALEIARVDDKWRISCTGCGEAAPLVQFRWQLLDQTVPCRCA